MKFSEIPDKCGICGTDLIYNASDNVKWAQGMDFYYAVCPDCKNISTVMCPKCWNDYWPELMKKESKNEEDKKRDVFAVFEGVSCCEHCGRFIKMADVRHGFLHGHQCDRHRHDGDGKLGGE